METLYVDNQIDGNMLCPKVSPSHFTDRSKKSWTDNCGTGSKVCSPGNGNFNSNRTKKKYMGQDLTSSFKNKKKLMLRSESSLSNSSSSDGFESYFEKK